MKEGSQTVYAEDYLNYLVNRGTFRKFIRRFYLNDIRRECKGKTMDFGCGAGELLSMLPEGSVGFEINPAAVHYCNSKGLHVTLYHPETDQYRLDSIPGNVYQTFTMNHVLEHLDNPFEIILKIFQSCDRLHVERIVFTVPGHKGFKLDKTHRTFINRKYFEDHGLFQNPNYTLNAARYFPVNSEGFSRVFLHNELRLVFDKRK